MAKFFFDPSTPRGYRAAAWGVAIVGVIAWRMLEQRRQNAPKFEMDAVDAWNKGIKARTLGKSDGAPKTS
jgi:hypothetical protein